MEYKKDYKKRSGNQKPLLHRVLKKRSTRRALMLITAFLLVVAVIMIAKSFIGFADDLFGQKEQVGATVEVTAEPVTEQPTTAPPVLIDLQPLYDVPLIYQYPELPAGCEICSATMLLQAYGYDIDKEEFAEAVPKAYLEVIDDIEYAPYPYDYFIGSPYSDYGFGTFSTVIADTMQTFIDKENKNQRAVSIIGADESEILDYIDKGIPVCIWGTIGMLEVTDSGGWYVKDGDEYTDEYYQWPGNEHCMVLISYDDEYVTVCDPLSGVCDYERELFFERYDDVGRHAVVIKEEKWE